MHTDSCATTTDAEELSTVAATTNASQVEGSGCERFSIHRTGLLSAYLDFTKGQTTFHILNDFNWEDHAFSTLQKYDQATAFCLNKLSDFAFEMSNGRYGDEQVESTYPLRNAIVKYCLRIHGLIDKYFVYENINTYLNREFKAFAKMIMCSPRSVKYEHFASMTILSPEDRCHLCILVMEAKKRVELLYFTKVLSELIAI